MWILIRKCVERDLVSLARGSMASNIDIHNLNAQERSSLHAAKGGLVVVMDANGYREEALRQLSDSSMYLTLRGDPTKLYRSTLWNLVQKGVYLGVYQHQKSTDTDP